MAGAYAPDSEISRQFDTVIGTTSMKNLVIVWMCVIFFIYIVQDADAGA